MVKRLPNNVNTGSNYKMHLIIIIIIKMYLLKINRKNIITLKAHL